MQRNDGRGLPLIGTRLAWQDHGGGPLVQGVVIDTTEDLPQEGPFPAWFERGSPFVILMRWASGACSTLTREDLPLSPGGSWGMYTDEGLSNVRIEPPYNEDDRP